MSNDGPRRYNDADPRELGRMDARLEQMEWEIKELQKDVKELLALANRSRGGLWLATAAAGIFGAGVTFLVELFAKVRP